MISSPKKLMSLGIKVGSSISLFLSYVEILMNGTMAIP